MTKFGRSKLNRFQTAIAASYGNGDYAYLIETGVTDSDLEQCGDTLFAFLIRELADEGEYPMDKGTADQRINSAIGDLEAAVRAITAVQS